MKRVVKGPEPPSLLDYRDAFHHSTWESMKDDAAHHGDLAYQDCRAQALADQHCLCAYCERTIEPDTPHRYRVEHFHSKADRSGQHNWALDWQNMLVCCDGGEQEGSWAEPLPENLSCDAAKNYHEQRGHLAAPVEEALLNPLELPAFPNLFWFDKATCTLHPNAESCASAGVDTSKVQRTLDMLQLNCQRLTRLRHKILINIDQNKKVLRQKHIPLEEIDAQLVRRYFASGCPEFFTSLRCCLGQCAEEQLKRRNFAG